MRRWRPVSVGQLGSRYGQLGYRHGGSELGYGLGHGLEHGVQTGQVGQWHRAQALGALISQPLCWPLTQPIGKHSADGLKLLWCCPRHGRELG